MTTAQWRGRLDDDAGDDAGKDPEAVDSANGAAKARALLGSLLRPHRYTVAFLAVVVVLVPMWWTGWQAARSWAGPIPPSASSRIRMSRA